MRIVHVIFSMNTGGAELMLSDIMSVQSAMGHEVSLLIINNTYTQSVLDKISDSVDIHILGRPEGSRNPLWIWRYNRMLRRLKPDVVHLHHDRAAGLLICRPSHPVYVGTVHATNIVLSYFNRLDEVYAISKAVKNDIMHRHSIDSSVVYNGLDFNRIAQSDSQQPHTPFRIVQCGRVVCDIKGQDILVRAIAGLTAKGYDVSVDFIGEAFDKDPLCELARELGVEDRINFLGLKDRDYIYSHLKDYDLFVQPSRYEGFGLTLVEAMAAKIPVLASDVDGPAEILDENRYGLLFRSEDSDECARAIASIIDAYPIFKGNAAGSAYRHALDNYSIEATAANYISMYSNLISRKHND